MLHIQITRNYNKINIPNSKITQLVKYICKRFELSKAEISIVITDNARISEMNLQYKQKNQPTDCLSFNLSDQADGNVFEIIVNGQMAKAQAEHRNHSAGAELALYITHGLLHQLGFDDQTLENAKKMHDTEDKILQYIGFGIVYND
jgi:probable rRNA maturation factor